VNPHVASDGGLWSRCAATVQMSRTFSALFLQF
jgi:hypothetical protein